MRNTGEKRPIRPALNGTSWGRPVTRKQAQRIGERNMPPDLKRAGFQTVVFASNPEIHGAEYWRINYGK